jgi:hypothetical protein
MGVNDIVTRLRQWAIATDAVPASDLMDEAAAEIELLRLTDAEREAIVDALQYWERLDGPDYTEDDAAIAATLRGLLERTDRT